MYNVVYLNSHDTGRWVEPYGYCVPTPNLQRFAERACLFRNAFCAAPTCSPSRSAMLTSLYPHVCGMHGLANHPYGYTLDDYGHHFARLLRDRHGFKTAVFGMQHEADPAYVDLHAELGYDECYEEPATKDFAVNDADPRTDRWSHLHQAAEYRAAEYVAADHDRPFFIAVGFGETHRRNDMSGQSHTYDADPPTVDDEDGRYLRAAAPIPDAPTSRRDWAAFRRGARRLDERCGVVLEALEKAGRFDDTIVLITTDHGPAWPHGKGNLTDLGTGVMMMLRYPGMPNAGDVIEPMVSQLDVVPTLCDLLGIERGDWMTGCSMRRLMEGGREPLHEQVFTEQGYHCERPDPQRAVRTERYKYIRRGQGPYLRIVDPGPVNGWLKNEGYADQPAGAELLYDLLMDPLEMCNRIEDPAYTEIADEMRQRLDAFMEETSDPFRSGEIPPPPGLSEAGPMLS